VVSVLSMAHFWWGSAAGQMVKTGSLGRQLRLKLRLGPHGDLVPIGCRLVGSASQHNPASRGRSPPQLNGLDEAATHN